MAGGGTDLSPYCDDYGGAILNVAINRFAHAVIEPRDDHKVVFIAKDLGKVDSAETGPALDLDQGLRLHRAIYNRFAQSSPKNQPLSFTLTTSVDCPVGSGLGASSALVVAIVEALRSWLGIAMDKRRLANLAFEIERLDASLAGGRQDHYAAAYGGLNFMEFASRNKVIVNRLSLDDDLLLELESSILLAFTGSSRVSSTIIEKQISAIRTGAEPRLESLHQLKRDALEMKTALMYGEYSRVAAILNHSWQAKISTAPGITNQEIDRIYERAMNAGAIGGKISGAGGGGFMMFLVEPARWSDVAEELRSAGVEVARCTFCLAGSAAWAAPRATLLPASCALAAS
jgi:D-glycero-alpha-D-manno-heptose-7-phosphate kinase